MRIFLSCFTFAALATFALIPTAAQAVRPQAAGTADIQAGQKLFVTACRICHGEEGIGNRAPSLRGERYTAEFVSRTVKYGRPGTVMPKFEGSFKESEINQLGAYVASLQERSAEWATLQGNAEAGQKLFFEPTNNNSCQVCHVFKGQGGKVGPDLTTRLAKRSPREIFQRIVVVPHRSTDPSYLRVVITTRSGESFTGIKTEGTENQFNFYDTASLPPTLRTLPSAEVVSTKRLNGTAMPSDYASKYSLKELLDLVAFLRFSGTNPSPVTLADVVQERPKR